MAPGILRCAQNGTDGLCARQECSRTFAELLQLLFQQRLPASKSLAALLDTVRRRRRGFAQEYWFPGLPSFSVILNEVLAS